MTKKIHTRQKRRALSPSHIGAIKSHSRIRLKRPKTFLTKEKAVSYAEQNKMKNYDIVNMRVGDKKKGKFKVVASK